MPCPREARRADKEDLVMALIRADDRERAAGVSPPAERIVVGEHPHGRTAWRERTLARARREAAEWGVPFTQYVADKEV